MPVQAIFSLLVARALEARLTQIPTQAVVGMSNGRARAGHFQSVGGEGVRGTTNSDTDAAVVGMSNGRARAGHFQSVGGEGVRGTTNSDTDVAVVGMSNGRARAGHFQSVGGEGVRGTTNSDTDAAVVGMSNGRAHAGFFQSVDGIGVFAHGTTAGHFEGDVEVTGDIRLLNADCAEDFDTSSTDNIQPGTVMTLNEDGVVESSQQAYDKKVAGVISGAGGYKPGIVLDRQNSESKRIPIALMGKVYCKVDANYSSIGVGDLLTTSNTLGHAMKAADPLKAFGAVIGKALRPLKTGKGLIPILIALQ